MKLNLLVEETKKCNRCPLHKSCNQVVGGLGPPASLFIVGEVSDKEDDIIGEPFSNVAGKLLRKLMTEAGLNTEDTYFTNSVKCKTKKLMSNHIDSCKFWLWKELQLIKPRVVLTLGMLPTKLLLNLKSTFKMKDVVGNAHPVSYIDANIFPWYHPNYIFNRGKDLDTKTVEFFKQIKELL